MTFEKKRASVKQEIPTTSMPDIVFMLLMFFMVVTTLREYTILVQFKLPEAKALEKIENKRLIQYIWVGKDGRIQINDSVVKLSQVEPLMYAKREALPNVIVSLRIDKDADMGEVTDIQQELRKASALRINYSANLKGS
jgi:biopolymer transport protein ExbD